MTGISLSMNCPSCGGAVSIEEGWSTLSCPYCNLLLAIEGDEGVEKITLMNLMDREKAVASVRGWWRSGFKARDLKKKGEITECYPIYVPFWKLKGRAAGWVCGYDERYEGTGKNRRKVKVPKEEMVLRDLIWNEVACDAGDIGIEHLKNLEGKAVLYDGGIPTFEVTTSDDEAKQAGLASLSRQASSSAHVQHVTFSKVHVFPKELQLIFYPIWVTRYRYSGRMYFATVDGITGRVLSGRAPGDNLWRSVFMTLGTAAGGWGMGLGAWLALKSGDDGAIFIGGGTLLVCLAVAAAGYGFFRHGSEMTTGDVKGGFSLNPIKGPGRSIKGEPLKAEIRQGK